MEDPTSFSDVFWATFAGGLAAALVSILGIVIVEWVRARQQLDRDQREAAERLSARRRASRNAALAVLQDLAGAARPLERWATGQSAWESMHVSRKAWDDQMTRHALNDLMSLDALLRVEHAFRELAAQAAHFEADPDALQRFAADGGKLARKFLELHVHPARDRLAAAIAIVETLEELRERTREEEEASESEPETQA